MIKIEDNVSIVLLSIALVFNLMYAFMHIFDPFAVLFLEGISQSFNGEMTADLDAMVSNVGWFFMIFRYWYYDDTNSTKRRKCSISETNGYCSIYNIDKNDCLLHGRINW
jgi:hypothetical protein